MKLSKPQMNMKVIESLKSIQQIISVLEVDGVINLRAMDAVGKLPQIMDKVESTGVQISDLSVRQNTLEDVFIELTGSSLRE
jgi:ABC-2 type transport system ATP-binding protein